MTTPSRPSFDDVMEQARRQFVATGQGTVSAFEELAPQLTAKPDAADLLATLRRELHRLHGSAGTFGFAQVGRMAAALESAVKKWIADPDLDRERRGTLVGGFARTLKDSLVLEGDGPALPGQRLMLVQLTDAVAVGLTTEAASRGYHVERLDAADLAGALEEDGLPHALIAAEGTAAVGELDGVPRLFLRRRDRAERDVTPAAGLRVLDARTEPTEVLDALATIVDRQREAAGWLIVVDDDPVIRQLVRYTAEHAGLAVVGTADAEGFRAAVKAGEPTVLVVDVELPGISGIDLVRELRSDPSKAEIPILVLSGHSDVETRSAAYTAGCDDYMMKPFAPGEFQRRIAALLETTRRRRAGAGMHPVAGVSLPSRTIREIESELATRPGGGTCVGIVQPVATPGSLEEVAAWQREVRRLGIALRDTGGIAGFIDDFTLAFVAACPPRDGVALITGFAGDAPEGAPAWRAGVVGAAAKAGASVSVLFATAREAWHAAIEAGVPAREWDPGDSDIAPDVIVVEDDMALADLIAFALSTRGFSHRHFGDGPTALEGLRRLRVRGQRPIILLDIDLPGLDGHSLHDRLRVEMPGIFEVVFLSAHGAESEQLRALKAGALDFLVKPISLRVLTEKLAAWRSRSAGQ